MTRPTHLATHGQIVWPPTARSSGHNTAADLSGYNPAKVSGRSTANSSGHNAASSSGHNTGRPTNTIARPQHVYIVQIRPPANLSGNNTSKTVWPQLGLPRLPHPGQIVWLPDVPSCLMSGLARPKSSVHKTNHLATPRPPRQVICHNSPPRLTPAAWPNRLTIRRPNVWPNHLPQFTPRLPPSDRVVWPHQGQPSGQIICHNSVPRLTPGTVSRSTTASPIVCPNRLPQLTTSSDPRPCQLSNHSPASRRSIFYRYSPQ